MDQEHKTDSQERDALLREILDDTRPNRPAAKPPQRPPVSHAAEEEPVPVVSHAAENSAPVSHAAPTPTPEPAAPPIDPRDAAKTVYRTDSETMGKRLLALGIVIDYLLTHDIIGLNNLLMGSQSDEVAENQFYSNQTESTLNPGNIGGGNKKKEVAKPNTKIEAKYNNRILTKEKNEIWTEKDFVEENIKEDGRPKPKFEVLYKQKVGTEDIYLGLSDKDISSNSCDQLLIKVYLPDTNLKEIGLEVKDQSIHLTTPNYLLNHILPYKVYKEKTEAKWDKQKGLLLLTLYIIKQNILDQLVEGPKE